MKKFFAIIAFLATTLIANAQFEAGKVYVGASFSGADLSYNSSNKFKIDVNANGGYFLADNWMVNGTVGLNKAGSDANSLFTVGAGVRYLIQQNGLFAGIKCKCAFSSDYNDVMPGAELGYAFFINDKVTIEPSLYYNMSLKSYSKYSTVGVQVGIGLYL